MQTVTITPKFQIHIPVKIREQIGLTESGKADIFIKGDSIIIKPKKRNIMDLAGSLTEAYKKNPIDIDNIRDYIDYSDI